MAVVVNKKNGKQVTLLNPAEKAEKFKRELSTGIKRTNSGQFKTDANKKGIRLTDEERAYRSGYISARIDSAKAYYSKRK